MTQPSEAARVLGLSARMLDQLMPLHVWVGAGGQILHVGRTLRKICGATPLEGRALFEVFEFRRPRRVACLHHLLCLNAARVSVTLPAIEGLAFKGVVVALPAGTGALLDLSLGISVQEAVRRFRLDLGDFSPADLAAEMLFLIEANAAVMGASQSLTTRLEQAKRAADTRALTDTLTGLNNRRAMDAALSGLVAHPGPKGFALMHVDLDYFKAVNDTLGHAAGDKVLQKVAQVLRGAVREDDLVCRVGGDEFVLLIRGCDDPKRLDDIAARILAGLEHPIEVEGVTPARISASIGITLSQAYGTLRADQLLSDADQATYAAKSAGRAQARVFFPPDGGTGPVHAAGGPRVG